MMGNFNYLPRTASSAGMSRDLPHVKDTCIMTTRRETIALLAGSAAGALLSPPFTAHAGMDGALGAAEYPTKPLLPPERRSLAPLRARPGATRSCSGDFDRALPRG